MLLVVLTAARWLRKCAPSSPQTHPGVPDTRYPAPHRPGSSDEMGTRVKPQLKTFTSRQDLLLSWTMKYLNVLKLFLYKYKYINETSLRDHIVILNKSILLFKAGSLWTAQKIQKYKNSMRRETPPTPPRKRYMSFLESIC